MSMHQLLGLSFAPVAKAVRAWWIRRQIAHVQYQLDYLRNERKASQETERYLMKQQAILRSDERNL